MQRELARVTLQSCTPRELAGLCAGWRGAARSAMTPGRATQRADTFTLSPGFGAINKFKFDCSLRFSFFFYCPKHFPAFLHVNPTWVKILSESPQLAPGEFQNVAHFTGDVIAGY